LHDGKQTDRTYCSILVAPPTSIQTFRTRLCKAFRKIRKISQKRCKMCRYREIAVRNLPFAVEKSVDRRIAPRSKHHKDRKFSDFSDHRLTFMSLENDVSQTCMNHRCYSLI
jgi:hypothetical protein